MSPRWTWQLQEELNLLFFSVKRYSALEIGFMFGMQPREFQCKAGEELRGHTGSPAGPGRPRDSKLHAMLLQTHVVITFLISTSS